ncbi:MAG: DegT/DnrJ/EryC1/StrS family aminotransferase [Actinomycetota bacterium]
MSALPFIDLAAQRDRLGSRIDDAIAAVLDDGRYVMGPAVVELEHRLAEWSDRTHALSCASGTDALVMALMALDVQPGDRVVVPDFTFVATAEVVRLVGATPVFADIDAASYNLDPGSAATAWQLEGPAPVGIIAVDLFGHPASHNALGSLAERLGAWMIVDGAQSFGATRDDHSTLAAGIISTTSFFPAKPLGAYGDGGAVFTDDDEVAERLRSIRLHGAGAAPYTHDRLGITGRLDTIQAAILNVKLDIFADEIERRNTIARRYSDELSSVVKPPTTEPGVVPVWAQYTIEVDNRDGFRSSLNDDGVPTGIYYPYPLHTQGPYQTDPVVPDATPNTAAAASRVVSLPMHPYLDEPTQDLIIDATVRALETSR